MGNNAQNPFHTVAHEIRNHFVLNLYCSVFYLITYILRLTELGGESLEQVFEKYPFLGGYFEELHEYLPEDITWEEALSWWQGALFEWERESNVRLPLASLGEDCGIGFSRRVALVCVGLVEEDSRFGTLFEELQEPLGQRRPGLELVGRISLTASGGEENDSWQLFKSLVDQEFIEVMNPEAPRSEWIPRVPAALWDALRGEPDTRPVPGCEYRAQAHLARLDELILPSDLVERLRNLPKLLDSALVRAIVLRGMEGSERLEVLGAVARALDRNVIAIACEAPNRQPRWGLIGALCSVTESIPVITYDLGPGETVELEVMGAYKGPVGVLLGYEGGVKGKLLEQSVTFNLPAPNAAERLAHWQHAFNGHPVDDLELISARFQIPGLHINKAAHMAAAYAALDQNERINGDHIQQACRTLNHQMLDTLATRLDASGSWDRLVVSPLTDVKLKELQKRCRYREQIIGHLGRAFQAQPNRGVRALLSGPSGTGKTLAAKILAAQLGMDLYRVDLAAVINKYIGETEKNLHRVLARAEELDVILLLDEGDALLARRTDVKSSNDRYANLETNYLLQRLENYQGIVLITSNAAEFIDPGFERRMDIAISFVPPDVDERWHIWQLHLAAQSELDPELVEDIAERCTMTGGQIRNAAQHATLLAMGDNRGIVTNRHLQQAIESEYHKAGALSPLTKEHRNRSRGDAVEASMDALSSGGP